MFSEILEMGEGIGSDGGVSAIDIQNGAGDETGTWAAEEEDGRGDFFREPPSGHRGSIENGSGPDFVGLESGSEWGPDPAWSDGIDTDLIWCPGGGEAFCELDHAPLGGGITGNKRRAEIAEHAGQIDDGGSAGEC